MDKSSLEPSGEFACRRCGACCRIPDGIVRVPEDAIARISDYLGCRPEEFVERWTDLAPDRRGLVLKSEPDGACVFLSDDNLCRIHAVKPGKCRTFPREWRNRNSADTCPALRDGER